MGRISNLSQRWMDPLSPSVQFSYRFLPCFFGFPLLKWRDIINNLRISTASPSALWRGYEAQHWLNNPAWLSLAFFIFFHGEKCLNIFFWAPWKISMNTWLTQTCCSSPPPSPPPPLPPFPSATRVRLIQPGLGNVFTSVGWRQLEPRNKKTSYFPLYWLFNRDPYNGLLQSLYITG